VFLYEKEKESRKNGKLKVVGMFKIFMNFHLDHMPLNKWRVTSKIKSAVIRLRKVVPLLTGHMPLNKWWVTSKLSLQLSDSDKWYRC